MNEQARLLEKLRKIEALHSGAATAGERDAAASARERIHAKLRAIVQHEKVEEFRFTVDNPWSRKILVALMRRYGIKPYRYSRQRRNTVMARLPRSFAEGTLMPEFREMELALFEHLEAVTDDIILQGITSDTSEAHEVQSVLG